jgi:hypothetical protein
MYLYKLFPNSSNSSPSLFGSGSKLARLRVGQPSQQNFKALRTFFMQLDAKFWPERVLEQSCKNFLLPRVPTLGQWWKYFCTKSRLEPNFLVSNLVGAEHSANHFSREHNASKRSFTKSIYNLLVLQKISIKMLLLQKISEKVL